MDADRDRARSRLALGLVAALLVAAFVYVRTGDDPPPRPGRGPLASPAAAPGTVGGLLPDITLANRYGATPARQLRPAVVLLMAPGCDCVRVVRQVVADAAPWRIPTYAVVAGADSGPAESLAAQSGGEAGGFADQGGALAAAYRLRSDAALVLVRRDGVVTQVVAAVAPSLRLEAALRALVA